MRFAYADPPYMGQAKRLYGDHRDYAGEVDHADLVNDLCANYDGWALSLSMKSLPTVMRFRPLDVLTLAWVKPIAPPMGDHRHYSWEPVILRGGRRPTGYVQTHLVLSPPQFTFRERPPEHVIGEKPEGFCRWLFDCAGLTPDDEFVDLFPGSGAVGRAWKVWSQTSSLFASPQLPPKTATDYGTCRVCGQRKRVRKDGRVARHPSTRDWDTSWCKGSDKSPTPTPVSPTTQ